LDTLLKHKQDSLLHIKVMYELEQKKAREENYQRVKENLLKKDTQGERKNTDDEYHARKRMRNH